MHLLAPGRGLDDVELHRRAAKGFREANKRLNLADILPHEAHDDLGSDAGRNEVPDPADRGVEASLDAPDPFVGLRVGAVDD